jgi:hypothetical protein
MPKLKCMPKNIEDVRELLIDFPPDLEIELETGTPLSAKTVQELRLSSTWPHGLRLICNKEPGYLAVKIERD